MNDNFYKQLIDESPEGYAYHKIICNSNNIPVDFEFLEVNAAFEKHTGLKGSNIIGRKVTDVIPGIRKSKFDWIKVYGDVAINGGKKELKQYSDILQRWYSVTVFSPEKYYFITQFFDISKEMIQISDMKKLSYSSEQFLQIMDNDIDYKKITEDILNISDAKYAVFNLYDEDGENYYSVATAGEKDFINVAYKIIGHKIEGIKWKHDVELEKRIRNSSINRFSTLDELIGEVIPKGIVRSLEKIFNLGEIILVKISKKEKILGYFNLFMGKGKRFEKDNIIKIYSRQVGLVITRKNAEKSLKENDVKYQSLFESARDAIFVIDIENLKIVDANGQACKLMGYTYEELIEKTIYHFSPPEQRKTIIEYKDILSKAKNNLLETAIIRKDGKIIPAEICPGEIYHIGDQKVVTVSLRDITERKKTEEVLNEERKFTEAIFDSIPGLLYVYDDSFRLIKWNKKHEEMTGYTADELSYMTVDQWFEGEESIKIEDTVKEIFKVGYVEVEAHLLMKGGEKLHLLLNGVPLSIGGRTYFTGIGIDIAERKQNERIVEHLAYFDTLTGLPNRTKAFSIVDEHIKNHKEMNHKDALLYIDIDNFKYINDTFGHIYGDIVLTKVADKLKTLINNRIQVARLGGDEFIAFILDTDYNEVKACAETILSSFNQNFDIDGRISYISLSIGIAIYPDHASSYEELIQYADTAMYNAKSSGKARYEFFNASLHKKLVEKALLETRLRLAVENNELLLHYQPQLDLKTGKIEGFEALIRWNSPDYGLVSPSVFIPLAEETGVIIKIGFFVLTSAAAFAKHLQDLGYKDLTVSINVSVKQMNEKGCIEKLMAIVKEYQIEPSALCIEITESVLIESFDLINEKLTILREKGFHISLDDFGTGYSSLTYLKLLPINSLKIDKSFIDDILRDNKGNGLTVSIIGIAHQLGLSVVAEGVERKEQYQYLYENHCDTIQGYYFSKPLPEKQVLELLSENNLTNKNCPRL